MIPQQNLITYPLFGDNATKTQPDDAKMSAGFQQSDVLPAEWMNWAWNKNSKGITDLNSGIASIEKELIAVLTEADITPALATEDQVKTALYTIIRANASNYYTASCSTAADEEVKSIVISGFYNNGKTTVGVTFANENTYGDTTADTPTNPKLSINGTEYDICDSRGHIAGTGCWNADDYIEFLIVGTKALITNSEVRQSVSGTSGYTIYSNGLIRQWKYKINITAGKVVTLQIPMKDTNYWASLIPNHNANRTGYISTITTTSITCFPYNPSDSTAYNANFNILIIGFI